MSQSPPVSLETRALLYVRVEFFRPRGFIERPPLARVLQASGLTVSLTPFPLSFRIPRLQRQDTLT